ncbi:MAG: CoA ester lyase [Betaproteobacteria bacterium]|nr:CoA ester lyase [Betaproteobacteria bacterium]
MSGPRSLLTVPANRADMLAKAPSYGADALILDLEDSVPIAEKPKARALAREFIGKLKASNILYVRVNALQTGMLKDDLEAIVIDGLAGVKHPKAESAETIRSVDAMLTELERRRGLPPGAIGIEVGLESAKGVWFAYEIASASARVRSVMIGTAQDGDLQADLGYTWSADGNEVLYARSRVLLAARAASIEHVLDGAYSNVRDPEGLRVCCEAARKLGYRGKSVIHPNQIETVNRVFMPTAQEIDYYHRVIEAFDAAVARGSAATTVDGKLVDYAMVAMAKRVLAWAASQARSR